MSARRGLVAMGVAAGWLGGCLSVPDESAPMCVKTSDCDHARGEVCVDGTCYGNPPPGPFAAVISPPSNNVGLVSRELPNVDIPKDGDLGAFTLERPVTYTASLRARCEPGIACENLPVGATVTVMRASAFAGGPGFRSVTTVDANAGTFQLAVPASTDDDPPFVVTIVPDGRNDPDLVTAAQLVPPRRTTLPFKDGAIDLGSFTPVTISGAITNANAVPLPGYRVVALGRWDAASPPTEVSTVAYTKLDGRYRLVLADGLIGPVEVVAKQVPVGSGPTPPTLHLGGVPSDTESAGNNLVVPAYGAPITRMIAISGADVGGTSPAVAGARVTITGGIPADQPGASYTKLVVEATTDAEGKATVQLYDGPLAPSYRLAVVPPAGAEAGVLYDHVLFPYGAPVTMGSDPLRLRQRVALRGMIHDQDGAPVADVAVTARPSLRFQWSLAPGVQAFLAAIPPATTVTMPSGEFVVWVDPVLADVWGHYDLAFEPSGAMGTSGPRAPSWSVTELEIPHDPTQAPVTLPPVRMPDAAFVRAKLRDRDGAPIEGAELKLFRLSSAPTALCGDVMYPPSMCPVPAQIAGRNASTRDGKVQLILQRP